MDSAPSSSFSAPVFAVTYPKVKGDARPLLAGAGELVVHPDEPRYRFTGDTPGAPGRPAAVAFASAEIRNVVFGDALVQFDLTRADAGPSAQPFVFACATPAQTAAAAALLPRTQDDDFVARRSFARQLGRLPSATAPWKSVTNLLIAANVIAYVAMALNGAGWIETASMEPYARFAANNGGATTDGEWWRLVTCMFVHFGLLHIGLNMWALYQSGHFVERLFGRPAFTLAYFGSGIVAGFTTIFWHGDQVWSAGASGAIFGIFGALLGFALREKQSIPRAVLRPLMKSTLTFAGYNLLFGAVVPHIDNSAHIGGFAGGLVFGCLLAMPVDVDLRRSLTLRRLALGGAALVAICAAGVAFSPRFDYRFRERIAWQDVNRAPATREAEIGRLENEKATALRTGGDPAAFADWIEQTAVPFYTQWQREVDALTLAPGKETARERQAFDRLLAAKLKSYRRLVAALRAGDIGAASANAGDEAASGTP